MCPLRDTRTRSLSSPSPPPRQILQLLAVVNAKLGVLAEDALAETDVVMLRKSFDARTKKVSFVMIWKAFWQGRARGGGGG